VGEAAKAPEAGALDKKKDNFMPSRLGPGIVFQKADKPNWHIQWAARVGQHARPRR
jgi:hypothetical protein